MHCRRFHSYTAKESQLALWACARAMHQICSIAALERGHKRSKSIATSSGMDFSTFGATHICHDMRAAEQVDSAMAKAIQNQKAPTSETAMPSTAALDADPDCNLMKGLSVFEVFRRERILVEGIFIEVDLYQENNLHIYV